MAEAWEKTVLSLEQMQQAIITNPDMPMGQAIAKVQAKAAFQAGIVKGKMDYLLDQPKIVAEAMQAGEQAGIQKGRHEVVEWLELNKMIPGHTLEIDGHVDGERLKRDRCVSWCELCKLQSKLKEWGLE